MSYGKPVKYWIHPSSNGVLDKTVCKWSFSGTSKGGTAMSYQQENDALITSLFERTFFESWKTHPPELMNFQKIEFMLN